MDRGEKMKAKRNKEELILIDQINIWLILNRTNNNSSSAWGEIF